MEKIFLGKRNLQSLVKKFLWKRNLQSLMVKKFLWERNLQSLVKLFSGKNLQSLTINLIFEIFYQYFFLFEILGRRIFF